MEITLQELTTELDSFDIYSIFKDEQNVAFLDSGTDHETLGRYSFIGINPFTIVKGRDNHCQVNGVEYAANVFDKLNEILECHRAKNPTDIPFIGGCIGYISYDIGPKLENIRETSMEDLRIPHYYFIFYDNLIIFDHHTNKKYISSCGILHRANQSIAALEARINGQPKVHYPDVLNSSATFASNFSPAEYIDTVTRVKDYIRSGDIYIANLTQRFSSVTEKDAYTIYRDLRNINPAPFAALMRLSDCDIISSSPERFIRIVNRQVETRPIKGTRPRGTTPQEDLNNKHELLNSEKDRAELLMIVDLERNDLSKVCKPHSVKVTELFKLEEYSTVFHLVSTVVGELEEGVSAVDCLKACFPGGSITGTPKIRAMEIIDELEGINRSLYTGCIGYFSYDGNADFNIVIRTIIKQDKQVCFGVGGGITWDSDEEAEYQETLDKAKALMRVI